MEVRIEEYSEGWIEKFKEEEEKIKEVLNKQLLEIHHIGSTSVPNLKAKPIIDILLVVKEVDQVDKFNEEFEKLGYEAMGEHGIANRRFFKKGGDDRSHHIHAFDNNNRRDIERHLAFRDYLIRNKSTAKEYQKLKEELAEKFPNDMDSYCEGKDAYIKKVEELALEEYIDIRRFIWN